MQVRVGCEFLYDIAFATPSVLQVQPRPDGEHRVIRERWELTPETPVHEYSDLYGNICRRLTMPAGNWRLFYLSLIHI